MNNDTRQVFGEDTHDHRHDAYPHDPGPAPGQDDEDFPAFRGWAAGERVEPVAPDDEYPQPSFSGYEPALLRAGVPAPARSRAAGLPAGARGYALDPGYARDLGYPHDPEAGAGYLPARGYVVDHGYVTDLGFAEDPGYAGTRASGGTRNPCR